MRPTLTKEQLAQAKCEDSPMGTHHWLLPSPDDLRGSVTGRCKYCGTTRVFTTGWASSDWHLYREREHRRRVGA